MGLCPVQSGCYLRPDQFLDHLTVIIIIDSVSGGSNVNSVNSEAVHSANTVSDKIVFAWNLAKRNSIAAF